MKNILTNFISRIRIEETFNYQTAQYDDILRFFGDERETLKNQVFLLILSF